MMNRPKWTFSDPERYGYSTGEQDRWRGGGVRRHCCPSCWAGAPSGEPITHKPDCERGADK